MIATQIASGLTLIASGFTLATSAPHSRVAIDLKLEGLGC